MTSVGWFDFEGLALERLNSAVTAGDLPLNVLSIDDINGVKEASLPKPSVRLAYGGHRITTDSGISTVDQTWLTVLALRNVRGIKQGTAARSAASPLVDIVFDLFLGWQPAKGFKALVPATSPVKSSMYQGVIYVPLAWTASFRRLPANCS